MSTASDKAEGSEKLRQQVLINIFFTNEDESHLNKRILDIDQVLEGSAPKRIDSPTQKPIYSLNFSQNSHRKKLFTDDKKEKPITQVTTQKVFL